MKLHSLSALRRSLAVLAIAAFFLAGTVACSPSSVSDSSTESPPAPTAEPVPASTIVIPGDLPADEDTLDALIEAENGQEVPETDAARVDTASPGTPQSVEATVEDSLETVEASAEAISEDIETAADAVAEPVQATLDTVSDQTDTATDSAAEAIQETLDTVSEETKAAANSVTKDAEPTKDAESLPSPFEDMGDKAELTLDKVSEETPQALQDTVQDLGDSLQ